MASNAVDGNLEEQFRSAVREEPASRSGSQSLVERTRQLINASASSASCAFKRSVCAQ